MSSNPTPFPRSRAKRALTRPEEMLAYVPEIARESLAQADEVSDSFAFRVPNFYAENVLNGSPDDPLLSIVFPQIDELADGDELWDATPSPYRASDNSHWIQKYEFQGLIRVTTACSGLCRFCYLKKKNVAPSTIKPADIDQIFDDLEARGHGLREIILSGGDPLSAPADVIDMIADRMACLRRGAGANVHISIHTREPVWDPIRLLGRRSLLSALVRLRPKTYMLNVLHPREVTPEFVQACSALSEGASEGNRPALLCQHPVFRGVNDSVDTLEQLYLRLMQCSPPVLPYYMVHPFYNGTLPSHRLDLSETQQLLRELVRRPGCLSPRLVVPTPQGKCQIGPNEELIREGDGYRIKTKDGITVVLA